MNKLILPQKKKLIGRRPLLRAALAAPLIIRSRHVEANTFTTTSGGGYNNLANWPSLANRPVYTNGVLNWIGPTLSGGGGAVPSTTSDSAQSLALTPSTSSLTTTSNGQVISGLAITAANNAIVVAHNNVTVQACYLNILGTSANNLVGIYVQPGTTGFVIQDCEVCSRAIDPSNGQLAQSYGIAGTSADGVSTGPSNLTAYRLNMYGWQKGVGQNCNNGFFYDGYDHASAAGDNDHFALWCASGGTSNVIVQHYYFYGYDINANVINTLTSLVGGSGYSTGLHYSIPLTGGSGQNATADITVNGSGIVTNVALRNYGTQYAANDVLSASNVYLGGGSGSGFTITVGSIYAVSSIDDSCVGMTTYGTSGTITGVSVLGCACVFNPADSAHQLVSQADYPGGSSAVITNATISNNGFYGSTTYNRKSGTFVNYVSAGNFIMSTMTATSGSPTNGTGAV